MLLPIALSAASCLGHGWWPLALPCSENALGNAFLMAVYGYILSRGSKLIADGSELLCEIIDPGLIGGFVLPVLGAVPDAVIIAISALAPPPPGLSPQETAEAVNKQISVGVGTLAGSTIMLLTIPFWGTYLMGRCDIVNGEAVDGVCTSKIYTAKAWLHSGITVKPAVPRAALIMIGTTLGYFVIQGFAFWANAYDKGRRARQMEHWPALAALIVTAVLFIAYSIYSVKNVEAQKEKFEEIKRRHMMHNVINTFASAYLQKQSSVNDSEGSSLLNSSGAPAPAVAAAPAPDMKGVGLRWKMKAAKHAEEAHAASEPADEEGGAPSNGVPAAAHAHPPKWKIALIASTQMLIGTAIVCLFSDGMVDAITGLADTIPGLKPFYVSFVVTPVASNASELIASLMKKVNTSLSVAALFGASTMNNTLCLGLFLAIIFFKGLVNTSRAPLWDYTAETLAIVLSEVIIGLLSLRKTTPLWWSTPIFLVYPAAIGFVALLEGVFNLK